MKKSLKMALIAASMLLFGALTLAGCELGGSADSGDNINGGGSSTQVELISTAEQLLELAGSKKQAKLSADIDLSSYSNWTPIENFSGTLDGDGHKITDLTVSGSNGTFGLFGTLKGTVKNLTLEDISVTVTGTTGDVGGLCGINEGTLENIMVDGTVTGTLMKKIGGIVGTSNNLKVNNCTNRADVTGFNRVGGVVGTMVGSVGNDTSFIEGNKNYGTITGIDTSSEAFAGGVFGRLNIAPTKFRDNATDWTYTMLGFENYGDVRGEGGYIGGVIGYYTTSKWAYGSTYVRLALTNCENAGDVSGNQSDVGGILGGTDYMAGALMCSNTGNVTGNANYVGGICGGADAKSFSNCSNSGAITGKAYVGGIAGYSTCGITNCMNEGTVTAQGKAASSSSLDNLENVTLAGGIVGLTKGRVTFSENTGDIFASGGGSCIGGIAGAMRTSVGSVVEGLVNRGKIAIDGSSSKIGGVVGYVFGLRNSTQSGDYTFTGENYGDIEAIGCSAVGGIIGNATSQTGMFTQRTYAVMVNCINQGNIRGNSNVAAILGQSNYFRNDDFYWNTNTNTGSLYTNGGADLIEENRLHN